jgi:glycosyltransferase involved in cell wall biosynthesis
VKSVNIAVLIPCYNEEAAVESVVRDFLGALPNATVFVYDNNSTDRTAEAAAAAGAVVRREARRGKGHVIQRMFADVDADVYVLVDGDDTYDATGAPAMVERLCAEQLDLVNGARVATSSSAYRPGHRFGNSFLSRVVSSIFGGRITDVMSGYKVFSRRFVKTFAGPAGGFEIDTVLVIHALALGMPVAEVQTAYKDRMAGSSSKLRTFQDGLNILWTIFRLLVEEHPVYVFGTLTALSAAAAFYFAYPLALDYMETGRFQHLPAAVLAASFAGLSFLFFNFGLILDLIFLSRREAKRLRYLEIPSSDGIDAQSARARNSLLGMNS